MTERNHMGVSFAAVVCSIIGTALSRAANRAPGDAGPVSILLRGWHSPAAFFLEVRDQGIKFSIRRLCCVLLLAFG